MALLRGEKLTLYATLGTAILSIIAHIVIREWYQPDIRYELGSYYISGPIAVTSLKLMNLGHSDAEDIKIVATFNEIIKGINIDTKSVFLKILEGGKNNKFVSCEVPRLVSGQEIYLYFEVENKSAFGINLTKDFIKEIVYQGGKGKKGVPILPALLVLITVLSFAVTTTVLMLKYIRKLEKKNVKKLQKEIDEKIPAHNDQIIELIQMAVEGAATLVPLSDFEAKVDKYLENAVFGKPALKLLAMRKYNLELKEDSTR